MKKCISSLILLFLVKATFAITVPGYPQNQIAFKENKGQISDQNYKPRSDVLFSGNDGGLVYHLKANGISYQLSRIDSWKEKEDQSPLKSPKHKTKAPNQSTIYRIDINWLNANENVLMQKDEALPGYDNYYLAVCPNGVTNVKSYGDITYKNIYNGIDLHYYGKDDHLKYDYIVKPNSNYKQIQLQINGAEKISVNKNGELVIKTPLGEIIEQTPLVIQNSKQLPSKWVIKNNVVSFEIENVNNKQTFTIDPVVRAWGTYCGGTGIEWGNSTTIDSKANVYMAGDTWSPTTNLIATAGAYQTSFGGSNEDGFLEKYNSAGVRQWGSYYGGTGDDIFFSCEIDYTDNVYAAGYTQSSTGISTLGAHQINIGGANDAFLVKFDNSGLRIWSTYYGGNEDDIGRNCAVDLAGNVYLGGDTKSDTTAAVIATPGCHQQIYASPNTNRDGFFVKFNSAGVRQWGTYYGGFGNDEVRGISTDKMGDVFIAGYTSTNTGTAIATPSSYQPVHGGMVADGYLAKFSSSGVRQWGTYYGGSGGDILLDCSTDGLDNVYAVGQTSSFNGTSIATVGSHQSSWGGNDDAFLVKFDGTGVRLWGTYYGGSLYEWGFSCDTDTMNNIYFSGATWGAQGDTIATLGSHQSFYGGGSSDAYIAKFNANGIRQWGTYYGGPGGEDGKGCKTNGRDIYLAGQTGMVTTTMIATPGSSQSFDGGSNDAYLVQFYDCTGFNITAYSSNNMLCVGQSATLIATGAASYTWSTGPTTSTIVVSPSVTTVYTVTGTNSCGTDISTFTQTVTICTGINENKLEEPIRVYPNPNNGEFVIETELEGVKQIELIDVLGNLVRSVNTEERKIYLSIGEFNSGLYFLKINSQKPVKLVKE